MWLARSRLSRVISRAAGLRTWSGHGWVLEDNFDEEVIAIELRTRLSTGANGCTRCNFVFKHTEAKKRCGNVSILLNFYKMALVRAGSRSALPALLDLHGVERAAGGNEKSFAVGAAED